MGAGLKRWDGSAWVPETLKVWTGAAWAEKPLKYWDGTQWVGPGPSIVAPAFRSQSTLSYSHRSDIIIPAPAGVAADDILLACVIQVLGPPPLPTDPVPPSGWTQIGAYVTVTGGSTTTKFSVFWKRAGGSEPADYTWGMLEACNTQGMIQAWSGCPNAGSPLDGFSQNSATTGNTATGTGVTATQANDRLVYMGHNWDGTGTLSPPAGMTERFDSLIYAADQVIGTGASGDKTQTLTSSNPWTAFLVALKGI